MALPLWQFEKTEIPSKRILWSKGFFFLNKVDKNNIKLYGLNLRLETLETFLVSSVSTFDEVDFSVVIVSTMSAVNES